MGRPITHQCVSDDDLLHCVLALPPARLWRFFDQLAGRPEVAASGWRISERRQTRERFPERNRKIRQLATRLSYAQIGRMFGMSRYAVRNIVKRCERTTRVHSRRRLPCQ